MKVENYTKKLISSQDVVDAINNQQRFSNNERMKNGLEEIDTIPVIHNYLNQNFVNELVVDNLRCYYNFFTDKHYNLSSVIISDLKVSIKVPHQIFENVHAIKRKNAKIATLIEYPVIDEKSSTEFLEAKHLKMKKLIDLRENYFIRKKSRNKYFFLFLHFILSIFLMTIKNFFKES